MTNYFRIEAPWPALASTMLLPSPRMGNNLGLLSDVRVITMMDGSKRSFVKTGGSGKKMHRWDFFISSDKMEEFVDLVKQARREMRW